MHLIHFQINLIWTCVLFHVVVYTAMIVTFYIHPSEFHSISFVDMFSNSNGYDNFTNVDHHGVDVVSSNTRYSQTQNSQYYYHHHSDDIIRKSVTFTEKALVSVGFQRIMTNITALRTGFHLENLRNLSSLVAYIYI